jgi:hypothetical protein
MLLKVSSNIDVNYKMNRLPITEYNIYYLKVKHSNLFFSNDKLNLQFENYGIFFYFSAFENLCACWPWQLKTCVNNY